MNLIDWYIETYTLGFNNRLFRICSFINLGHYRVQCGQYPQPKHTLERARQTLTKHYTLLYTLTHAGEL